LQTKWLEEHEIKFKKLLATLAEIDQRFASIGEQIEERINSEEYLALVRKSFKVWDDSDTDEKRNMCQIYYRIPPEQNCVLMMLYGFLLIGLGYIMNFILL
jgi:hypothetical protein